jgi:hypothetical protein
MPFDYTDAPPPQFELIPLGTTATCILHVNPGGVGEDGMLTRSKDGGCEMLVAVLTLADGPYKGRKVFERWILEGTTEGHADSMKINRGTIKAILDSAHGLNPKDESPKARAVRTVSLGQLQGITFIGRIGVEKGKPKNDGSGENWPDRNVLAGVITPDKKDWHPVEQPPPFSSTPSTPAAPVERPGWAQ